MTFSRKLALGCALAVSLAAAMLAATPLAQADAWYAWSPKPDKLVPYGKNKPVTRLKEVLAKLGIDAFSSTPEEFAKVMVNDLKRWTPVVKAAGMKPE